VGSIETDFAGYIGGYLKAVGLAMIAADSITANMKVGAVA